MLEAAEADVEFESGVFRVKGTDRQVSFREVAKTSYNGLGLPPELGIGLSGAGTHPGPNTFPNGCMVCEVEVEPETGSVAVLRLSAADDVGVVVNPLTLEGQSTVRSHRASVRRCLNRSSTAPIRDSSSPARSWITACRGPSIFPK